MGEHFLSGIKISGYRSFNDEVTFDNLSKINLVIGQNNSGKSNLLRFLARHLRNFKSEGIAFSDIEDRPKHNPQNIRIAFRFDKDSELSRSCVGADKVNILNEVVFKNTDFLWFYYNRAGNIFEQNPECISMTLKQTGKIPDQEWFTFWHKFSGQRGAQPPHWQKDSIERLNPAQKLNTQVDLIPATRSLSSFNKDGYSVHSDGRVERDGFFDHSGVHLIDELFQLQNPPAGKEADKERFNKINEFMKDVIGNKTLQLEIPHDRKNVVVNMDDKRINITELGSGIEEILIIAAKSTMFSNQIVCIEEPELHLHPTLQRKLLRYLYEKTDNQYFIATHSAHLLDAVKSSIYHIKLIEGYSQVVSALNDRDKFTACNDLGYKASDLLQSNFIIWVEGPSDRIYLNHWIKSINQDLIEGLHYSIMFYGGRLLSHLSAKDKTINEFISLQRLNQNMAIVIDSDRRKKGEKINATKQRIRSEFEDRQHLVWITQGKEIENYLSPNVYTKAVKSLYPNKVKKLADIGQYNDMTVYYSSARETTTSMHKIDKIRLAHKITKYSSNLNVMDLDKQINVLVNEINNANLMNV